MRRTVVAVAAVAVLALGVGVGLWVASDDDDGSVAAGPDGSGETGPVIPSAAGPPGTELGDGFTVVEGTVLIGDPIPAGVVATHRGEPVVDEGWTATLLVDGAEPRAVVEAYLAQAEAAGLAPIGSGCGLDVEVLVCGGGARTADVSDPRSVSVKTARGPRGDIVSDHVVVRYATTEMHWEHGAGIAFTDDPTDSQPGFEPVDRPELPGVGDPLGSADEVRTVIPIQEGSRLAGPVRLHLDDATGGIVAVLEVTGDPDEVLRSYLDVLDAAGGFDPQSPVEEREVGDATITQAYAAQAGGDHVTFTLVERPGRPVWLEVNGNHD